MTGGEFLLPQETLRAESPFVVKYQGNCVSERAILSRLQPPYLRYEVPIRRQANGCEVELNPAQPGSYTLSYAGSQTNFEIAPREQLGIAQELALTTALVVSVMGVAILWTKRKRNERRVVGSSFHSGLY